MNAIIKDDQGRAADRNAIFEKLGLTMEAVFVPLSQSRNARKKHPSLNWSVTLTAKGGKRLAITTDYMQGIGHIPGFKHASRLSVDDADAIKKTCETGRIHKPGFTKLGDKLPPPTMDDVLFSLLMDSSAMDYATYEEWANEMGYEQDSRKGEAIYHQCLKIALKLRAIIGNDNLEALREAYQDY